MGTPSAGAGSVHVWQTLLYGKYPYFKSLTDTIVCIISRIVWPCIVADSLWIKPTDAPNSNFIGTTTLHVSGSLSAHHQEFLAVHRLWYIFCSCDRLLPGAGWNCSSILFLVANGSSQLHKMYQRRCMAKNSWWWAERLPETCRVVIPIKLEFSASVGFIHKESVTMHGHTIVKYYKLSFSFLGFSVSNLVDGWP